MRNDPQYRYYELLKLVGIKLKKHIIIATSSGYASSEPFGYSELKLRCPLIIISTFFIHSFPKFHVYTLWVEIVNSQSNVIKKSLAI